MKKLYLLALINVFFINLDAQYFDWAKREGLYQYDYGYGISTDQSGNVYVAGKFEMTGANFSGTTLTCQGNHDIYVAKYTTGGALTWIQTGGGLLGDYAHALSCDGTANVYIAGEIEWANPPTVVFPGSTVTLVSHGDNDAFVANYDLNGNLKWAVNAGGGGNDRARAVGHDAAGNVYIAGMFTDTCWFGSNMITGFGQRDIFVAKYDPNGAFLWARAAGSANRDEAHGIKCDAAGNVYISGLFSDGANFGGTMVNAGSTGFLDGFIAKYDASGNFQWVKTVSSPYDEVAWSITMDNGGKLYIAGEFNAAANFGGGVQLVTAGMADAFVACYDASGNIQWAKRAGGPLLERIRGINTDGTNLYVTGQFGATASFDTYTVSAADSSDIFVAAMDPAGNWKWATSVGGPVDSTETLGYESGDAICADASGNVFATGALLNGGTFGSTTLPPYSRTDMWIAKLSLVAGINSITPAAAGVNVYPNPSGGNVTVDLNGLKDMTEIRINNLLGQVVEKHTYTAPGKYNLDLSGVEKGIYLLEIKSQEQTVYTGKVVLK